MLGHVAGLVLIAFRRWFPLRIPVGVLSGVSHSVSSSNGTPLKCEVFRPRGAIGWAGIGSRLATNGLFNRSRTGRWLMGRAPELKALNYVQASRFEALFDVPQDLELDGDPVGRATAIRLTVLHRGLTLRVRRTPV